MTVGFRKREQVVALTVAPVLNVESFTEQINMASGI